MYYANSKHRMKAEASNKQKKQQYQQQKAKQLTCWHDN